jgi:antitoxin component YwqK of YwqJK toxin-antitoxin module
MKTMRRFFVFLILFLCLFSGAQTIDEKGRKQGYWKKKDADNKLVYEGEFKNDKPVGRFKYYYANDSVRAVMYFKNEGKIAYAKLFHANGKRMAEGKYVGSEVKDSAWLFYDEAGVLISKDNYRLGKKNGTCFVYLPDGGISEERNYKMDVQNGEWKEYFDGVNLRSKGKYLDGKLDGRVAYYYPNGVEVAAGFYKQGQRNGPWIYKTESNKIRERELYKDGKLAGKKETDDFFSKNKEMESQPKGTEKKPADADKKTPKPGTR